MELTKDIIVNSRVCLWCRVLGERRVNSAAHGFRSGRFGTNGEKNRTPGGLYRRARRTVSCGQCHCRCGARCDLFQTLAPAAIGGGQSRRPRDIVSRRRRRRRRSSRTVSRAIRLPRPDGRPRDRQGRRHLSPTPPAPPPPPPPPHGG